jgi:hypothetical protein
MADFIIIDGDVVSFLPNFGAAIVQVQPGKIKGSGPATLSSKKICVDGDEASVSVAGCLYMTPQYSIAGTGTLKIKKLAGDQLTKKTKTGQKAMILKGKQFTAEFQVQSPAQQPQVAAPPTPDSMTAYSGFGMFQTTNTKFMGT